MWMWKSSWIFNIFNWSERWQANITAASEYDFTLEFQIGGSDSVRRMLLTAAMRSTLQRGRFWSEVQLTDGNLYLRSFGAMRLSQATEMSAKLDKAFVSNVRRDVETSLAALNEHEKKIKDFSATAAFDSYESCYQFLQDNGPAADLAISKARSVLNNGHVSKLPELAAQVKKKIQSLHKGLEDLHTQAISILTQHFEAVDAQLDIHRGTLDHFKKEDRFLRRRVIQLFTAPLTHALRPLVRSANLLAQHPLSKELPYHVNQIKETCKAIRCSLNPDDSSYGLRNREFIKKEMQRGSPILAKLNSDQQKAAIAFEDRNLLVAAAGSGKSWTLIGKIGYALNRNLYRPQEIIALAFNTDAADELNTKICNDPLKTCSVDNPERKSK